MKIKTLYLLIFYIGIILLFGFIYSNIPDIFSEQNRTFARALYFSVIIITTLGYADIIPTSSLGMGLVAVESLLGIVFIALFSGTIWQTYISNLEKTQARQIKTQLAILSNHKLKMFSGYFFLVINEYRIAYKQFMMPLSKVSRNSKINVDFKFSDLKYFLENATNQAVVSIFYEKQDICSENLKHLLSNPEVFRNKRLYTAIVSFLHLSLVNDPRNAILSTDVMKKHNHQDEMTIDQNNGSTTRPLKIFYNTLKMQYRYLKIVHHELKNMTC